MVQWLRFPASTAGVMGSISDQGNKIPKCCMARPEENSRKFSEKPSNPFTQFFTWGIKAEECWWAFVPRHCRLDWGRAGTTYISCLGGATPALCSEAVSGGKWVIWLLYLVSILIRFPCNLESIFSFILFGRRRTKEGCLFEVSPRFEEDSSG